MAQLGMTPEEYDYWVSNLSEACKLIGQDAKLFPVESEVKDIYFDPTVEYKEAVDIGLIFDGNPKPILKKFNWLTEDEDVPYVCYLVAKDRNLKPIEVRENMKIVIPSVYGVVTERTFLVSHVRGTSIDPLAWICKLVPYRPKVDMKPETPEVDSTIREKNDINYGYLRR